MSVSGFAFDANRCTGCAACSLACSIENDLGWGTSWRQIVPFNPERRAGIPSFHLSLACNHCADAPCVTHCPTGAMQRDAVTGAVIVAEDACIGCRYCAWVCPFDAPRFDEDRGVMTKCTFCNHRLLEGGRPACVEACPTDALGFGETDRPPLVPRIQGFPVSDVAPRIGFVPLRRMTPPESTWSLPAAVVAAFTAPDRAGGPPPAPAPDGRLPPRGRRLTATELTLRGELPLWLFTTGMAALAGWIGAAALGAARVDLPVFLAAALALLATSTLHLGRPTAAWRAITNVRGSALSQEIAGVSTFLALATAWVAWGGAGGGAWIPGAPGEALLRGIGIVAAVTGWLALVAIDRVYHPVRPATLHSSATVLTGPLFAAAILQNPWAFAAVALPKLLIGAARVREGHRERPLVYLTRFLGLAAPPVLWMAAPGAWPGWPLLLVAAGELADRAGFYRTLTIPGPRRLAREEATAWPQPL